MISDDDLARLRRHAVNRAEWNLVRMTGNDLVDIIDELTKLRALASAAERGARLRGWTSDAEVHPGRGEAERELARAVEGWRK